jgi:hypothetical protein
MTLMKKTKQSAQKGLQQMQPLVEQEKRVYLEVLRRMFSIHLPKKLASLLVEQVMLQLMLVVQRVALLLKSQTWNQIIDLELLKEVEDLVTTLSQELEIGPS